MEGPVLETGGTANLTTTAQPCVLPSVGPEQHVLSNQSRRGAVYIGGGRYHPGANIENIFDAQEDVKPGVTDDSGRTVLATEKPTAETPARTPVPEPETAESASSTTLQSATFHPTE